MGYPQTPPTDTPKWQQGESDHCTQQCHWSVCSNPSASLFDNVTRKKPDSVQTTMWLKLSPVSSFEHSKMAEGHNPLWLIELELGTSETSTHAIVFAVIP